MSNSNYKEYERLIIAIMQQAVLDYRKAVKKTHSPDKYEKRNGTFAKKSLERFFLSDWGQLLSGNNGQFIVDKLREEAIEGEIDE